MLQMKMMKTILLGIAGAVLLTGCLSHTGMETGNPVQTRTAWAPDSLRNCQLELTTKGAMAVTFGSTGMDEALKEKFRKLGEYRNTKWRPCSGKGLISEISFSQDKWRRGKWSGNYTCENLGNNQLFVTLHPDDIHTYVIVHMLLDFNSPDSGTVVYTVDEEMIVRNIQFKLFRTSGK